MNRAEAQKPDTQSPPSHGSPLFSQPTNLNQPSTLNPQPPSISDHELLKKIGRGSYGEVWLARNILGKLRAVKVVHRSSFEDDRPFQREFEGIQKFEPISRSHPSQLAILHVGRNDEGGYFYYVMELADCAESEKGKEGKGAEENNPSTPARSPPVHFSPLPATRFAR